MTLNDFKHEDHVYSGKAVYGPYVRKDNRQFVIVKTPGSLNDHKTVSYPRYLVEVALNRYLDPEEQVDHIDGNFHNNDLRNLRILKQNDHARSHVPEVLPVVSTCPICGSEFTYYEGNFRKTCSRHCAGILGHHPELSNSIIKPVSKYISRRNTVEKVPTVQELVDQNKC